MNRTPLGLGRRLGRRLRPLAVVTGAVIVLGLPTIYYTLESERLSREAARQAGVLAQSIAVRGNWDERDVPARMAEFASGRPIAAIRLRQADGTARFTYETGGGTWWTRLGGPTGEAPLGQGHIEIVMASGNLLGLTGALLVLATAAGVTVGYLMYTYPLRVVRAAEAQIEALITRQESLLGESEQRRRTAEALADIGRVLAHALDPHVVGERIADRLHELLGAAITVLFRIDDETGDLVALAVSVTTGPGPRPGQVFPRATGLSGIVASTGQPMTTPDLLNDPRLAVTPALRAGIERLGYGAVLAVPLTVKDRIVGVLSASDRTGRVFGTDEVRLAQAFADQAALALETARLYQSTQQAYRELSEAQARLVRGETLRAMGELASGVAHHLNNLLAVVLGRLQLARAHRPGVAIDRHLQLAERATLDSAEVVRRMRGFSRGQVAPELSPVNLNSLAREVLELTRPRWQDEAQMRNLRIDARLEADAIPEIRGEPAAFREVLLNLVLNAIDALPDGGTITVRTWASDTRVFCQIADTGTGMTAEVRERALEPFFTTKGLQSTGLGLSVNYGIVKRHDGELTIESAPGEGTRVTFSLPVPPAITATPPPVASRPPAPLRILLVDDERLVRNVVAEMLGAQGHAVIQAANGGEALARLGGEDAFDLVLTDLGMPDMTGWEVARAAKARRPDLRVGVLTGWGEDPPGKPAAVDADFIVAKPVTADALAAAIAAIPRDRPCVPKPSAPA